MKGFEFRLARLARVRQVQEDVAKAAWQRAESLARNALERLESVDRQLEAAVVFQRGVQSQAQLDAHQILNVRRSIELLEDHRRAAQAQSRQARAQADEARAPWEKAHAAVEGLKRLEEKARTRFRIEANREEAKQADQVATERAARRKRRSA